jgi:hypothetical protein
VEPTKELVDDLLRERVLRARGMSPDEKLASGGKLFAYAAEITKAGIREQMPNATEKDVERILAQRLELRRRLEERPWN